MAKIDRAEWAHGFLRYLGFWVHNESLWATVAWEAAEGTDEGAKFNPLNTTWIFPGEQDDFNWVHVQNYKNLVRGYEAAALTLRQKSQPTFAPIRHGLKMGWKAEHTLEYVEASTWGTGGLALRILPDVKRHWKEYSRVLIGQ